MVKRLVIIILLGLIYPLTITGSDVWNLVSEDNGLRLYSKVRHGAVTSEYKGVCRVNHPIETVASVLSDISSYPKWFFRCVQSRKIPTQASTDLNFLLYVVIDTPWPFLDRDVVYKVVTFIDATAGKIVVRSTAVETSLMRPQKNYVRITDSDLQWILEQRTDGQTQITFINRTHAAGYWGDIISGSGARATTLHSLENLKERLKMLYSHRGTNKTGHGAFSRIVIPI